jgi:hypothetical protein
MVNTDDVQGSNTAEGGLVKQSRQSGNRADSESGSVDSEEVTLRGLADASVDSRFGRIELSVSTSCPALCCLALSSSCPILLRLKLLSGEDISARNYIC